VGELAVGESAVGESAVVSQSHHQVARDTADAGLSRLVWTLAVVPPLLALAQTLANVHDYRQPAVAVVVWLAVLGAGRWLVPRLRTGGLGALETAAAIAIAVAAVAALGAVHRADNSMGGVDLAVFGTTGLLVLLVLSRSAWVWLPATLLVFAVHSALLIRSGGPHRIVLSELTAAAYIIAGMLLVFAALRSALVAHVGLAARQAALDSRLGAERAAQTAVEQERRGRLAMLERDALPLLRAIADGTLDPGEESVRDRCARHAAVLRQSLAGSALNGSALNGSALNGSAPGGELAAGLGPALRSAEARGLTVTVQLLDEPEVSPPVARAVFAAVDVVLGALPPHPVVLTVLPAGAVTELYLTFGRPLRAAVDLTRTGRDLPAAACWRAAVSVTEDGGGCLEVSWRRDGAD
jgi:hypothetical protein